MDEDARERLYVAIDEACDACCHGYLEHIVCRIKHRAVHQYAVTLLTRELPDQYHRDVVEAGAALHGFGVDVDQYLDGVIGSRDIPLVQTVVKNCGRADPVLVEGKLVQDAVTVFDVCIYGYWYRNDSPYIVSRHDSRSDTVLESLHKEFWYDAAASYAEHQMDG